MKKKFSYLGSRHAVDEIRKHKWIESEKCGHEVGFATAAFDWINLHGENWMKYYVGVKNLESFVK